MSRAPKRERNKEIQEEEGEEEGGLFEIPGNGSTQNENLTSQGPPPPPSGEIRGLPFRAVPTEENLVHLASTKARFPDGHQALHTGTTRKRRIGPLPDTMGYGKTRWRFPKAWIEPLHWYLANQRHPQEQTPAALRGATWTELALDFEMATRVMLDATRTSKHCNVFKFDRATCVKQRAANFRNAALRLMSICGGGKPQLAKNVRTLCPFSPHLKPAEGVKIRPNLMCNDEVFLELANQALVNARAFEPPGDRLDANAVRGSRACLVWKWPPPI